MALASKTMKKVEVKQFVEKQTGVTLVLSNEEAVGLLLVLNHVGGSPDDTPRCMSASIKDALDRHYPDNIEYGCGITESSLYFRAGSITKVQEYLRDKKLT